MGNVWNDGIKKACSHNLLLLLLSLLIKNKQCCPYSPLFGIHNMVVCKLILLIPWHQTITLRLELRRECWRHYHRVYFYQPDEIVIVHMISVDFHALDLPTDMTLPDLQIIGCLFTLSAHLWHNNQLCSKQHFAYATVPLSVSLHICECPYSVTHL